MATHAERPTQVTSALVHALRRTGPVDRALLRRRWASLRRVPPVSEWGHHRGTAVDRWYIERFLARHADLVTGDVLEVKNDLYASRHGAQRVQVLDVDPDNPDATIVGDLCAPATLPAAAFDAAVVTQTLQFVPDPAAAVRHLVTALRPGGALLLTVPAVSRLAGGDDRWRWTAAGFTELLASVPGLAELTDGPADVQAVGNCLSARAFLMGLASEDLDGASLAAVDPEYPLVVTAVVRRR